MELVGEIPGCYSEFSIIFTGDPFEARMGPFRCICLTLYFFPLRGLS